MPPDTFHTPTAEEQAVDRRRRVKLAVIILIFGPMVLFGIYHMVLGGYKMSQGQPVGYEQRDHRIESAD